MQIAATATTAAGTPPLKAHTPIGTIIAENPAINSYEMWDVKLGARYEGATTYSSVRDAISALKQLTDGDAPGAVLVRTSAGIEARTGWARLAGYEGRRDPNPGAWERLDLGRMVGYQKYFEDPSVPQALGVLGVVDGAKWAWAK